MSKEDPLDFHFLISIAQPQKIWIEKIWYFHVQVRQSNDDDPSTPLSFSSWAHMWWPNNRYHSFIMKFLWSFYPDYGSPSLATNYCSSRDGMQSSTFWLRTDTHGSSVDISFGSERTRLHRRCSSVANLDLPCCITQKIESWSISIFRTLFEHQLTSLLEHHLKLGRYIRPSCTIDLEMKKWSLVIFQIHNRKLCVAANEQSQW